NNKQKLSIKLKKKTKKKKTTSNTVTNNACSTLYVNAPKMTNILRGSILFWCIAQAVATNANANGETSYKTTALPRSKPIINNNKPLSINTHLNIECTVPLHLLPACLLWCTLSFFIVCPMLFSSLHFSVQAITT